MLLAADKPAELLRGANLGAIKRSRRGSVTGRIGRRGAIEALSRRVSGGAPVRPYQPAGIWEEVSFGGIKYVQGHGADLYRRSVYVFWRRSVGPPGS